MQTPEQTAAAGQPARRFQPHPPALAGIVNTLRRWAGQARACQLDALQQMQALDAATRRHMAHGAMAGGDPLTDSMYDQMQAAAEEGAQPAVTTGAWLTPQQLAALADTQADDWWLDWFIPVAATAVALLAAAYLAGLLG